MVRIEVKSAQRGVLSVWVELDNINDRELQQIYTATDHMMQTERQPSDAVAKAFIYAVNTCRQANPSDIWQHVIYRHLSDETMNDQQWKRVSGFALERVFPAIYNPRLAGVGVRIRKPTAPEMEQLLADVGLTGVVKIEKIDLLLEGKHGGQWYFFGGAHAKASIAERIQDDVPASVALMQKGFTSIMLTMDSKSYPPPHGDGVNRGELRDNVRGANGAFGRKERPKRSYIEDDGQFDALFSYNLRTLPSPEYTPSGKRIYTLGMHERQPDSLAQFLAKAWQNWSRLNLQ